MIPLDKTRQLKKMVHELLTSQIDNDYVLLALPYHSNLGATLIWQGELDFLKTLPYRRLFSTGISKRFFMAGESLRSETILLFHGGGNFGDVWDGPNEFRRKAISTFPQQKCIILPQTIYYQKRENLENDAAFYAQHPNVTICARDQKSLQILKEWFPNNPSLLVPDMAFCMEMSRYHRCQSPKGTIFLKREDREYNEDIDYCEVPKDAVVTDWTFLSDSKEYLRQRNIIRWSRRFDRRLGTDFESRCLDAYWHHVLRSLNVSTAIGLIDAYSQIYTTRMHAAVISVILGKRNITLYDNSYGKSSSFYDTWLRDVDGLRMLTVKQD